MKQPLDLPVSPIEAPSPYHSAASTNESPQQTSSLPRMTPKRFLYLTWLFALIGPFQYGWCVSELNLAAFNDEDECDQHPVQSGKCLVFQGHSKLQWTLVVNAWVLGGAIGGLLSGPPADRYGRRGAMILNCLIMAFGAALQALAWSIWMLMVGRFFSGIASGFGVAVTSVYNSEISPAHLRGALGAGLQMSLVTGILAAACALFVADTEMGWRLMTGFPLVLAVINLHGAKLVMVESPRWLLSKGRRNEAGVELARLYDATNAALALEILESGIAQEQDAELQDANHLDDNSWSSLFTENRRPLIVAVGVSIAQQLSGINAVFYYSSDIFEDAGVSDDRVGTFIVALVNALATLGAVCVMNVFMKRRMLLIGTFGMLLACVGMTISFIVNTSWLSIAFTALYVGFFEFGLGPIPWMLSSELFPNQVRARAMSFASCINWLSNLVVGVSFPYVSDWLTKDFAFTPFVALLAVAWVFIWGFVPETTNKTLEEIQRELNGPLGQHAPSRLLSLSASQPSQEQQTHTRQKALGAQERV